MEIRIARPAGTCYGVDRALRLAREAALGADGQQVASIGALIHNPQAVEELSREGVKVVRSLQYLQAADTVVVRSHGVVPEVIREAYARDLHVIDATCPHVARAQDAAAQLATDGYTVVIVGEPDHPEVRGIRARAGGSALVVTDPQQLETAALGDKVGLVVQTTQTIDALEAVIDALRGRVSDLKVVNTICAATTRRQQAALALAQKVEVMIIVGGHNSGNTTRLTEISRSVNPRSYHVEVPAELQSAWFEGVQSVGVTAGASTPESQLQQVVAKIESFPS